MLATLVVDTLLDSTDPGQNDGLVSLREAIEAANRDQPFGDAPAGNGADEIVFASSLQGRELVLNGNQIVIRSALSIEGSINLNANRQSRHFRIDTSETVSLGQMTLFNGRSIFAGGSLQIVGQSIVNIEGVTFRNNESEASGGAIFQHAGQLNLVQTEFERNRTITDAGNGGALHIDSARLDVSESVFRNNSAARARGGAIHLLNGEATISNSTFERTSDAPTPVSARSGGFITNLGSMEIVSSDFSGGIARTSGGAIQNLAGLDIVGSTFSNNAATMSTDFAGNEKGGAISSTRARLTISGRSVFANNSASQGGAIFSQGVLDASGQIRFESNAARLGGAMRLVNDNAELSDLVFSGNQSSVRGGAISVVGSQLDIVSPQFFNNGSSSDGLLTQRGGAIDSVDTDIDISVLNANLGPAFSRNQATIAGGQIAISGGSLNLTSPVAIRFTDADAETPTQRGGAIFANGSTVTIENASLGGRSGLAGGVLYFHDTQALIRDSRISGISNGFAGALFATASANVVVENTNFAFSSASGDGGTIRINPSAVVRLEDSSFSGSRIIVDDFETARGGAIYNLGQLTVTGSDFRDNRASDQLFRVRALGGAIFNSGELAIESTTFNSNTAFLGGAIYSVSPVTISGSTFENNRTERFSDAPTQGAALYLNADAEINDTVFTTNIANNGGAIAAFAGQIVGRNLTFEGNVGGIINANAQGGFGGAILIANTASAHLAASTFEGNTASRLGGAIAVFSGTPQGPDLVVDDGSSFLRSNTLSETELSRGGAIGSYNASVQLRDSMFEENMADGDGGAVFFGTDAEVEIRFVDFDSNRSEKRGGGLFNSGILLLEDSLVARNTALRGGGLAESVGAESTIVRTEFVDNQPE